MRLQAKHLAAGTSYSRGAVYKINVQITRFRQRVIVEPFQRPNKHVKLGGRIEYADLSLFLREWQVLKDLSDEEAEAMHSLEGAYL